MCSYHATQTPDSRIKQLTVINKDETGICDEQIVVSLWAWIKVKSDELKRAKAKRPEKTPQMDVFLTLNSNASVYTVVVVTLDESIPVSDYFFMLALSNYAAAIWKAMGKDVKELEKL